ncbi:MAG: IclR family transcriptional regulator C-terminal domain-containing protein [Mycobacterium sp.]
MTSKLAAILLVFGDGGVHSLTEIASDTNLPTSTAHRLTTQMVAWRLLERTDDRSYRAGFPLRMMADHHSCALAPMLYPHLIIRALPVLNELSVVTRNEARLGILRGSDVLTLRLPPRPVDERVHAEGLVHSVLPAHASAAGKAMLAFSPAHVIDDVLAAGLPTVTRHTITSAEVLRQTLSAIRLTQLATSVNELELGAAAIACPVFFGAGRVAAAIELTNRERGRELEPAAGALSVACRSLSRQLATESHLADSRRPDGSGGPVWALDSRHRPQG